MENVVDIPVLGNLLEIYCNASVGENLVGNQHFLDELFKVMQGCNASYNGVWEVLKVYAESQKKGMPFVTLNTDMAIKSINLILDTLPQMDVTRFAFDNESITFSFLDMLKNQSLWEFSYTAYVGNSLDKEIGVFTRRKTSPILIDMESDII